MRLLMRIRFAAMDSFALAGLLALSGCWGMADYRAAIEGKVAINPDEYKVDPATYPKFHLRERFKPPPTSTLPDKETFLAKREASRQEALRAGRRLSSTLPPLSDSTYWRQRDEWFYQDSLERFQPVEILPEDVWQVTHRIGERLLIYSQDYEERECRRITERAKRVGLEGDAGRIDRNGKCHWLRHLYHVFINAQGDVVGGWKLLYNPEVVVFASDRRVLLEAEGSTEGWGPQPLFLKAQDK
jgi:hypothetical protein